MVEMIFLARFLDKKYFNSWTGLSASDGFGISPKTSSSVLTTKKSIFIDFGLPEKIIRGENMKTLISVHNLEPSARWAKLVLSLPKGVRFETAGRFYDFYELRLKNPIIRKSLNEKRLNMKTPKFENPGMIKLLN